MKITVYNQSGKEVEKIEVSENIFDIPFNKELVHQALMFQDGAARQATAKVKSKGEVRGGGKKPYAQKGTGRARAGSNRSPLWRGGGVIFGPTGEQNYKTSMNKKARRKALFMVLSERAREEKIKGLSEFVSDNIKTKDAFLMLKDLKCERDVLLVTTKDSEVLVRCMANLPNVKSILVDYLNVRDLLKYDTLIFLKNALEEVETIFSEKKELIKTNS